MSEPSMLRLLTRLVVGGIANGYDGLHKKLHEWDAVELQNPGVQDASMQPAAPPLMDAPLLGAGVQDETVPDEAFVRVTVTERTDLHPAPSPLASSQAAHDYHDTPETDRDRMRLALIGAVFAVQDRAERSLGLAGRAAKLTGNIVELGVGPVYRSRLLSPLRGRVDSLAERGQHVVDGWIELGQQEEQAGRYMANQAVYERVENAIEYLTANEEVQELVQSQSVGLVDEVVEEARERTVSADNFLEGMVRSMLRRPMRWELPDPPKEISEQAAPFRQFFGRTIKK